MTKVTVIIVNWNNKKDTLECLQSLSGINKNNLEAEIILIDNGSTDNSPGEIKKQFHGITLLENPENEGFAKANNRGMQMAVKNNSDYVLLLNNDTLVDRNFLLPLVKIMEQDKSIGLTSPKIYFAPGFEYHHQKYRDEDRGKVIWYAGGKIDRQNILCSHRGVDEVDNGQYETAGETDFTTGCCMLIRAEALKKAGFFDERYFLYYEDIDLNTRIKKAGYKLIFEPEAFLWHKNAASSGKPGSPLHNYYLTRNRLLFGLKYANIRTKAALLKDAFYLYQRNLPGERRGVVDFFQGKFGKGTFHVS